MLKKDIQPRPAYLKWAYIGMMTIGFVDGGGFPLPWFTKYVMQMGVLGLAILFLLVTGDFRRLKTVGQFAVMFGLPFLMMASLSMLYWALDFQQLNYMSRGCSTILYHVISLSAMCSAVYLFGRRSIDYTFYAMCAGNMGIVLMSIKTHGVGAFVTGLIAFAKSGGIDTNAAIKALEVHDLTFAFGLMLLFALCCERGKKRLIYAGLSGLFFFLGLKRIALIGLVGVFLMGEFIRRRKPKVQSILILLISIGAIVICFGYVYLIQSGLFNEIVHALEIDTMGRDRLYAAFQDVYDFSPGFRGYGIGYVTRYISIMTEAGVGVFGTHNFGGMHNDIVTMYIELGFWGFAFWIWYSWNGRIVWCQKEFGMQTALLLLYETIYGFITYATDNTVFYCYINTVFMLLPIAMAIGEQEQGEEKGKHERKEPETSKERRVVAS